MVKWEGVVRVLDFLQVLVLSGNACGLRSWGKGRGTKGKPGYLSDRNIPDLKSNTIDVQKPKKRLSPENIIRMKGSSFNLRLWR